MPAAAGTRLALLLKTSAEGTRSQDDPKIRADIGDLVAGMLDVFQVRWRPRIADHCCCFSQNDSRPCDAEPPMTQGIPTATWPRAAAETQPSATAPTPTWPQKSRVRLESEPLVLSSSTAASASLRTAPS